MRIFFRYSNPVPVRILALVVFGSIASWGQAAAKGEPPSCRVLLIGNALYANGVSAVDSAVADVDLLASALREVGCKEGTVDVQKNLNGDDLRQAIEDRFLPSIQPGEVAMFYFAGHALQMDQENYLLGVDFDPRTKDEIRDVAYLLNRFKKRVENSKPALFLMLLDAAYDDQALAAIPNYSPGLAEYPSSILNGIVIYSTAKDKLVPRGPSPTNGPSVLATTLATLIRRPGLGVLELASEIVASVDSQTNDAQRPYLLPGYVGRFQFVAPLEVPVPVSVVPGSPHAPYRNPHDKLNYEWVPGGTFHAGCRDNDPACGPDEPRRHEVTLPDTGFWIGQTEVTVQAYRLFVDANKRKMPSPSDDNHKWEFTDHPMIKTSFQAAKDYCGWVGGRLPSGDEWERAARGGTDTRYPWGDEIQPNQAKYFKSSVKTGAVTAPVKSFDPNGYQLFDVAGNVWEWTTDVDAKGLHQTRGGGWPSPAKDLHVTSVRSFKDEGSNEVGFRCLLPQVPPSPAPGN